MVDPVPGDPPAEVAEELGLEPAEVARSDVHLEVHRSGDGAHLDLCIGPNQFERDRVPVPERFVYGHVVDLTGLVEWLGFGDAEALGLPATASLEHRPDIDGDGEWRLTGADDDDFFVLGAYRSYRDAVGPLAVDLGPEPLEDTEPSLTGGEHVGSYPRPAIGDTDAWPDDVDGWRDAIRRLRNQNSTLRAADVRMFFAGLDDQVLELTEQGPVDQDGNPVFGDATPSGDSWDPATDPLDPALEEALRLEEVPGALPPPDAADPGKARTADDAGAPADEPDVVLVELDNTVAIVEGSTGDEAPQSRFHAIQWWWLGLGLLGFALVAGFCSTQLLSSDDTPADEVTTPTGQVDPDPEPAPEETAEEALRRATQDLLDGRTAEVEQTFTISSAQGENVLTGSGSVDVAASESRLLLDVGAPGTDLALEAVLTPDRYFVRPIAEDAPWIEADPGQIGNDPSVTEAGLGLLGIGETFDPEAMIYLADASDDLAMDETSPTDVYLGTVTLPVTGEGADSVNRWTQSVYGREQEELAGIVLRTELSLSDDGQIRVELVADLEEAIEFMGDDPQAENMRGIVLTNATTFTPSDGLEGATPDGQTVTIADYVAQQGQPGG